MNHVFEVEFFFFAWNELLIMLVLRNLDSFVDYELQAITGKTNILFIELKKKNKQTMPHVNRPSYITISIKMS